jgi:deferrochelatase/peroxidase EfeB
MPASEPQPILTPLTEAAIFLVLTVDSGAESAVRDLLADASGLKRSVGFRIPEGQLTCVVGAGAAVWDRLFGVRGHPGCTGSARWRARGTRRRLRRAICCSTSARIGWTCALSSPSD